MFAKVRIDRSLDLTRSLVMNSFLLFAQVILVLSMSLSMVISVPVPGGLYGGHGYAAAPAISYAAPAVSYAAPAISYAAAPAISYAAPAKVAVAAAPAIVAAPKVVAAAPAIIKAVEPEPYDPNPQYSFAYGVSDHSTGDSKAAQESLVNGVVHGSYSLTEADGSIRKVSVP